MRNADINRIDGPEAFQRAFAVSRETLDRLKVYADLLKRWQKTINLVAPSTLDDIWHRHFADSAQLASLTLPPLRGRPGNPPPPCGEGLGVGGILIATVSGSPPPGLPHKGGGEVVHHLDLGSGAGFPGMVLAIMAADAGTKTGTTRFTLVESDTRKAAFVREVARNTGVAVEILCARIETPQTVASVGEVDCVTARALAPLPRLIPLVAPYFSNATVGLFSKGRDVAAEIEESTRTWEFASQLHSSLTDRDGRIVVVSQLRPKRC